MVKLKTLIVNIGGGGGGVLVLSSQRPVPNKIGPFSPFYPFHSTKPIFKHLKSPHRVGYGDKGMIIIIGNYKIF